MSTKAQESQKVMTYFSKKMSELSGSKVIINRNTGKWGILAALEDMSTQELCSLIDYYFMTVGPHSFQNFLSNYDKIAQSQSEFLKEKAMKNKLAAESQERAREWRSKWQKTS